MHAAMQQIDKIETHTVKQCLSLCSDQTQAGAAML